MTLEKKQAPDEYDPTDLDAAEDEFEDDDEDEFEDEDDDGPLCVLCGGEHDEADCPEGDDDDEDETPES